VRLVELSTGLGKEYGPTLHSMRFSSFSKIAPVGFVSLLVTSIAVAASITFVDVSPQAWYATSVQQAVDTGIASGYKDSNGNSTGKFGPANSVTVAEAYKMVTQAAGYQPGTYESLRVAGVEGCTHWVCPYLTINLLEAIWFPGEFSLVGGLGDQKSFDQPISREDMARMAGDAFRISWSNPLKASEFPVNPYSDVPKLQEHVTPDPTVLSILRMTAAGIISGDTDNAGKPSGKFRPLDSLNRAEAVKIILGAMKMYGKVGLQPDPGLPFVCSEEGVLTSLTLERGNACCDGLAWMPQGNNSMGICQKASPGQNCVEKGGTINQSVPPQDGKPWFCCPSLKPVLSNSCQGVGCASICE